MFRYAQLDSEYFIHTIMCTNEKLGDSPHIILIREGDDIDIGYKYDNINKKFIPPVSGSGGTSLTQLDIIQELCIKILDKLEGQ